MKQKIMEKQAILDIVDIMVTAVERNRDYQKDAIETMKSYLEDCKSNGTEPYMEGWQVRDGQKAEAWLAAVETVIKHLEKLI